MKVQTFLKENEVIKLKELSVELYGVENVSGYAAKILRAYLKSISKPEPIPNFIKGGVTNGGVTNGGLMPKYTNEGVKSSESNRFKRTITNKKHLTTQELQAMADRLKG